MKLTTYQFTKTTGLVYRWCRVSTSAARMKRMNASVHAPLQKNEQDNDQEVVHEVVQNTHKQDNDTAGEGVGGNGRGGANCCGCRGSNSSSGAGAEREIDVLERNKFAQRLRQRDLKRMQTATSRPELGVFARTEADSILAAGTAEQKADALVEARKMSRRVYLEQREKKMIDATRDELRDEQYVTA